MTISHDTGISKKIIRNQHGGMAVVAIGVIFCTILILFMSINVGNIWATKNQLEDAADAMAKLILFNQVKTIYGVTTNPTPPDLINQLDATLNLQATHDKVTYQYQFGYTIDGTTFVPLTTNNPTSRDDFYNADSTGNQDKLFAAIALEIRSPIIDIGEYFGINGTLAGRSIRIMPLDLVLLADDEATLLNCYCESYCEGKIQFICMPMCMMFNMMQMMFDIMTLNSSDFFALLDCFFGDLDSMFTLMTDSAETMAETAWGAGEWAWTTASTTIHLN